jgi:hypothetical protein
VMCRHVSGKLECATGEKGCGTLHWKSEIICKGGSQIYLQILCETCFVN